MTVPTISLNDIFSKARLAPYFSVFKPASEAECLAIYFQIHEASVKMLNILNIIEVTLRNRIDTQVINLINGGKMQHSQYAASEWYKYVPVTPMRLTYGQYTTHDDDIARSDFGFWTNMLHRDYDNPHKPWRYIWEPSVIAAVFPGNKIKDREGLWKAFSNCKEIRNRLCHHKPIWKKRAKHNMPPTKQDALNNIRLKYIFLLDCLGFLSPDMKQIVLDTEYAGFEHPSQLFVSRCRNKYKKVIAQNTTILP